MASNAEQHYYQTPSHVIAAGVVLSLMDIFAVLLRFRARKVGKQPLKADDWLLIPATALNTGVGVCLIYGVSQKAFAYRYLRYATPDYQLSDASISQVSTSIKLEWTISMILPIALACTKASILLFYKRIFSISRDINSLLVGLLSFIVIWGIVFFLVTVFCCRTMIFAIWEPITNMDECDFFQHAMVVFCATGFVTDVLIIGIPIPVIWRLKLSTSQKLIASASFLLGAVTVAVSFARLIVSIIFVKEASNPGNDPILNMTLFCYWGMVECSTGVFAACLPTLQYFVRRNKRLLTLTKSSKLATNGSTSQGYTNTSRSQNISLNKMSHVMSNKSHNTSAPSL